MTIERKAFTPTEFKLDDAGSVTVAFAQLDVVDRDGDLTQSGAFPTKDVPMSAYGHTSWMGELPVGKGAIREENGWAIFEGKFFMKTDQGRNAHGTVKEMADLQEWSYGYDPVDYAFEQREGDQIRILKRLDVFEVSPVLMGAGIGTHTRAIKSGSPGADLPYAAHLALGLESVQAIVERSKARADWRAKEGRKLSRSDRDALGAILEAIQSFGPAADELEAMLRDGDPKAALALEALREESRFLGVPV